MDKVVTRINMKNMICQVYALSFLLSANKKKPKNIETEIHVIQKLFDGQL